MDELKNLNEIGKGIDKQWVWGNKDSYYRSCDYLQKINYCIQDLNREFHNLSDKTMKELVFIIVLVDWICERGNLIIYYVTYIQILSFGEDKTQFMASINNIKICLFLWLYAFFWLLLHLNIQYTSENKKSQTFLLLFASIYFAVGTNIGLIRFGHIYKSIT